MQIKPSFTLVLILRKIETEKKKLMVEKDLAVHRVYPLNLFVLSLVFIY